MKKEKVVARMVTGEIIKGYMSRDELNGFKDNGCGECEMVGHRNSSSVFLFPNQVRALFVVDSFEGSKPSKIKLLQFAILKVVKENSSLIVSTSVVLFLLISGFIFLM